ncbi:signal peptidase II [Microbacterium candidum]|uniref:Lipoprotein signal peptidase n=1 Tax=Microbacterium candidum TaxID=3041922 RepID=A0ABT7N3Y6_9MICO|nr:signal peptidase II [Microbacterium sp. ASV49]MDL9981425.1 signal peptidase II [Microbacterium sp. ASV49]
MTGRRPISKAAAGTIIAILAVLVLAADQLAKLWAIRTLPPEQAVHVIGDFLIFYLIRNSGAAFSLGSGVTWLFTIALSVVAAAIIVIAFRVRSRAWAIILGLLLGGVLGNLSDRLFREPGFAVGHVVDFISTPWMMPAIYNVADMFITTMMVGVAILIVFGLRLDGTRERRAKDGEPAVAAPSDAPSGASERDTAASGAGDSEADSSSVPDPEPEASAAVDAVDPASDETASKD